MSDLIVFASDDSGIRSQMAAALFNAAVEPARARAVAVGTHPFGQPYPAVAEAMREVGFDVGAVPLEMLNGRAIAGARWIVTMGARVQWPWIPGARRAEWVVEEPAGVMLEEARRVRDQIARLVWAFVLDERLDSEGVVEDPSWRRRQSALRDDRDHRAIA